MISIENYKNNPELVISNLLIKLKERIFLKTELDIVYSDLVNWERSNLLNIGGDSEKGDWKKLNYFEYIWVKIIQELRSHGFSYEEIEYYKSELVLKPTVEDVFQIIKENKEDIELQNGKKIIEDFESLDEDNLDKNEDIGYTIFEIMIARIIGTGEKWAFLFFKDNPNDFTLFSTEMLRVYELNNDLDLIEKLLAKSHLSVSLSSIISKFLIDGENSFNKRTISVLTKNEHNLLKHIRKGYGKVKSIKIRFSDREMELLEVTSMKKVKMEGRLLEYINKGEYQSISIDTVDGKIVNFENTQKIKL